MQTIFKKLQYLFNDTFKVQKPYVLSNSPLIRYFTFSSLYFAQGIPEGLTFFGIPAWLAMNGKSPSEIGSYLAVIAIPWSLKILLAPMMDRFTYLPMGGRKRPWVIIGQIGLIVSFLSAAFIQDPLNNITGLMIGGFFISLFGAFQDVATDGMAIDIIPIDEQARANGLMWGSKTIGTSLSLAIGTWIINSYGFSYAVVSLSIVIMFIVLIPLFFRENVGEKYLPWTLGAVFETSKKLQLDSFKIILKSLFKVFLLPYSLLMGVAVFSYAIGAGLMDAILPVFTIQKIGWTNEYYSQITASANLVGGLLGMFVGGILVDFFGKIRMMIIYLISFILLVLIVAIFKSYWGNPFFIPGFIFSYYTLVTTTPSATGQPRAGLWADHHLQRRHQR